MANPIQAAIAAARQRPALVVAVAGVGIAAAVVSARRPEEPPPATDAVNTSASSPIAGYGGGLVDPQTGLNPFADPFGGALATHTAAIVNAINAQAARTVTVPVGTTPGTVTPVPGPGPSKPPTSGTKPPPAKAPTPSSPAPKRISVAQAQAALTAIGAPASWATSGAWIRSPAANYVWASTSSMQAWARRVARDEPSRGYRVDSSGRIVRR